MKIRDGFVTNSSSTSYIIISKKNLTGKFLAKKLGLNEKNPNYYEILDVCNNMIKDGKHGFYHSDYEATNYELVKSTFGISTAEKYKKALKKGYEIYCGYISSDESEYEVAMCLDYLKYNDSDIFIDATENVW